MKVTQTPAHSPPNHQLAQEEYRVLCNLQTNFPQDDRFGTLTPLDYFESESLGLMITRKFDGVDLVRHASRLDASETRGLFHPVGLLLRRLHDSCPAGYGLRTLGLEGKLAYLEETYGAELARDPAVSNIHSQLKQKVARVDALPLRATWSHGDFKPENVLCNGDKYLILDTQLGVSAAFVYDLASFLDHVLLDHPICRRPVLWRRYEEAEEEFLAGYGGLDEQELAALRWVQLYFMLCYWGRYRQRGFFSKKFATWRIRPLVEKLAAKL